MNRLLRELASFCETHRLEEKILVSPSLAAGHQMTEALVRGGYPWVNLRVETLRTLAYDVVRMDLAEAGLRPLSRAQALALIEQACLQVLGRDAYFGRLRDKPGFHRALKATVEDLRNAEVSSQDILSRLRENSQKAGEVAAILQAYEAALVENGFVDDAEILRRAQKKVAEAPYLHTRSRLYLVPDSLDLSPSERGLLEGLACSRLHLLRTDAPSQWNPPGESVRMFHALGEENEVREVFRRILADGIRLDEVEILYTDAEVYLPLVHEISAQYELPCTFGEGVPAVFSRPGQAVLGYLDWLDGGYDATVLRRIVGADLLDLGKTAPGGERVGAARAARILRNAGIGWGRSRHISCLDRLIAEYDRYPRADGMEARPGTGRDPHGCQTAVVKAVRSFVGRLLQITPETDTRATLTLAELARATSTFVTEFARIADELDGMASAALQLLFEELSILPETDLALPDTINRLREAVRALYIGTGTPKPGHVHVSDCSSGGYSGRPHTFLVGLDESRHPGTGLQDPVLLDHERGRINRFISPRRLPLRAEGPYEMRESLRRCLARLRGQITVSYSCRNLLEDREEFPAAMVLEIYRRASGRKDADYTALRTALGRPAGFVPSGVGCLDESEWWLKRLWEMRGRGEGASAIVRAVYPWLQSGWVAEKERSSHRFTVFDGRVEDSDGQLDPRVHGRPVSCTQIETLARCPFAYFLQYVLEIEPPQDLARDPAVWLNPREFGSLLHEIFRSFLAELSSRGEKPSFALHWSRLEAGADHYIERWRRRVPVPNQTAFTNQRNDVLLACRTFLKEEEAHCREATPRYFEVPFGLPDVKSGAPVASQTPVFIDLEGGNGFWLRGCVDRVDWVGGDEYEVWDYKTGSSRAIREERGLDHGRQVQHALYARAVEILLARARIHGRVCRSGYFFPGPRGEGQRIVKTQNVAALRSVINTLFDVLCNGAFLSTPDRGFCSFCDYWRVCGGVGRANERSAAKLEERGEGNKVLEPFMRLLNAED